MVAVDTTILGVVEDMVEAVGARVEEGTASITGHSRAVCTSQVISIVPLLLTNSGSGETFATKYRVNRPRTRVAHSGMKVFQLVRGGGVLPYVLHPRGFFL